MLTEKEKKRFSRKIENIKSDLWELMIDIGETAKENPWEKSEDPYTFKPGPIMDLFTVYRSLSDIEEKFDGR
jgi:hypothetical protein